LFMQRQERGGGRKNGGTNGERISSHFHVEKKRVHRDVKKRPKVSSKKKKKKGTKKCGAGISNGGKERPQVVLKNLMVTKSIKKRDRGTTHTKGKGCICWIKREPE